MASYYSIESDALSHHTPPVDLSIGRADVSEESIKLAVDSLFQMTAKHYEELLENSSKRYSLKPRRFDKNPNICYHERVYACSTGQLPSLDVFFPHRLIKQNRSGESRYFSHFVYDLTDLKADTPMGTLLDSLRKKIAELGFACSKADVRLEKGYIHSATPEWHCDGIAEKIAITTCFSNRNNWSTRIINPDKVTEIFKSCDKSSNSWLWDHYTAVSRMVYHIRNKITEFPNETTLQTIEANSEPAKFGYLYNARTLPHRSPILSDLTTPLEKDDYRMFIRFH